ncbi:MAG: zinc ribbon domain-containing protein [Phaeospirillum sp.]|nr:zinc ribbon domain-containing protein [Phaeospirillum sp.]
MAETNSYILLDLDPTIDDWPTIEQRLEEKRREWALRSNQGAPNGRRAAQQALERIPHIKRAMNDPEIRREEARAARKELTARRREGLEVVENAAEILRSRGGYGTDDVATLVKRAPGMNAEEIEREFKRLGLPPRPESKPAPTTVKPRLDTVIEDRVNINLKALGLTSLYQFLDLPPQVSPAKLCAKADEIYAELRRMGKTDAESSARNDLVGVCKQIFATPDGKEKYDNGLALRVLDAMRDNIALAVRDNVIDVPQLRVLLKQAKARRIDEKVAEDYIRDLAGRRKWILVGSTAEQAQAPHLLGCGFCGAVAANGASRCGTCGEELFVTCPRCSTKVPTEVAACGHCGAGTGDWPLVRAAAKIAEALMVAGRHRDASLEWHKALAVWPGWAQAVSALAECEAMERDHRSRLAAIEALVRQGLLFEARAGLREWLRDGGEDGGLAARIDADIDRANKAFSEAESHRRSGSTTDAIVAYGRVLALCADHQPARQAMTQCPPAEPGNLRVTPIADGYHLAWSASPPPVDCYVVLRKAGGGPDNDRDGTARRQVRDCATDDVGIESGVPWYYAVYAERSGVLSPLPARSGPHLITAEVTGLIARSGDGDVVLEWSLPKGSIGAEVWRNAATSAPANGPGVTADRSLHDTGLLNGTAYHYRVAALYPDPTKPGVRIRSTGVEAVAVPVALPLPVTDLSCRRDGLNVSLNWTAPTGAIVQIRQLSAPPTLISGTVISLQEAAGIGSPVPAQGVGHAQVRLAGNSQVFFLPLSVRATTAVVGGVQAVAVVDAVENLRARSDTYRVALSWDWPVGADRVQVCWTYDRFPTAADDQIAGSSFITRREYDRDGHWQLPHVENKPHYFTAFVLDASGTLRSEPRTILVGRGKERLIHYKIVVKRRMFGKAPVDVRLELTGEGALPEAILVARSQRPPLSAEDGMVVLRLPAGDIGRHRVVPVPESSWGERSFAKLFIADMAEAQGIRLVSAAIDQLRLG